ncbi:MAG: hypothetical protein ACRD0W_03595 [Acidimicrobiales bacterium]
MAVTPALMLPDGCVSLGLGALACEADLGLFFVEETDPATGEHLGNYPLAVTHAALVQAAVALVDTRLGPIPELRQSC